MWFSQVMFRWRLDDRYVGVYVEVIFNNTTLGEVRFLPGLNNKKTNKQKKPLVLEGCLKAELES